MNGPSTVVDRIQKRIATAHEADSSARWTEAQTGLRPEFERAAATYRTILVRSWTGSPNIPSPNKLPELKADADRKSGRRKNAAYSRHCNGNRDGLRKEGSADNKTDNSLEVGMSLSKSDLERVGRAILELRPKKKPTLRSIIRHLYPKLWKAKQKGLTYAELAASLAEQGVSISAESLRKEMAALRGNRSEKAAIKPKTKTPAAAPQPIARKASPVLTAQPVVKARPVVKAQPVDRIGEGVSASERRAQTSYGFAVKPDRDTI